MATQFSITRNDDNKLYLLGAYQIGGGIYGAMLTLAAFANTGSYSAAVIGITILGLALFLFSVYCGSLLVSRRFLQGLFLSVYNNILQIIGIAAAGFQFKFISGFFGGITMDLTHDIYLGLGFDFSIINLAYSSGGGPIFLTFNIFAMVVLGFVYKMKDKLKEDAASDLEESGIPGIE